ncbi:MAG: CocE/NonD family hydrolase [Acidobacteriota bacterium]|nr:CocE/NonD family hydrolase [Acidobacteriota bacterium]
MPGLKLVALIAAAAALLLAGPLAGQERSERSQETRELLEELGVAPIEEEEEAPIEEGEEGEEDVDLADIDEEPEEIVPLLQAAGSFRQIFIEKNVVVRLEDGTRLRADVFRPQDQETHPAILSMSPYPKDVHFRDWNLAAWEKLGGDEAYGELMHWESADPQWWVPQGYVVVRLDAPGTGESGGSTATLTREEAEAFAEAVEWAAQQRWSNGRVAVMGISYHAMAAWQVAALQPEGLAAIVAWEGAQDLYGDVARHGGILSNTFIDRWTDNVEKLTGKRLPELAAAKSELFTEEVAEHNPDLAAIDVPLLSAGNWGGVGLHLRGNVYGFVGAGSRHKMLRLHLGDHVAPFYSVDGLALQKRFLDRWLRDIPTGIENEPPIKLAIRLGGDRYRWRYEYEWPIKRTHWTRYFLDGDGLALVGEPRRPSTAVYSADATRGRGSAIFTSGDFERRTEVTGPAKLKLWISTTHDDADLFVIVRNLDPNGREVTYPGSNQPALAAAYGWLRASHRELDAARSHPYRPVHAHAETQSIDPEEIVPVEIEILPTSFVLGRGHRLVVEVAANDDPRLFPFTHTDPDDRVQEGQITIHTGGEHDSHLLLPIIRGRR